MEASFRGHTQIAKNLLDYGSEVDAKNKDGLTALIFAANKGHIEVVKQLINHGADINVKSNNGMTALEMAISKNYHKIAKLLDLADSEYYRIRIE